MRSVRRGTRDGIADAESMKIREHEIVLIPMDELAERHGIDVRGRGVVHCGGHRGEEADDYARAGADPVFWIEGNPALIEPLAMVADSYGHHVIGALLSDVDGAAASLHVANNGQSSSLLPLGTHAIAYPEVRYVADLTLRTRTLDSLHEEHDFSRCVLLNCDLQGAEGLVLRGAEKVLAFMEYLYLEVNEAELYEGAVLLPELTEWLAERGFEMVDKRMAGADGWGDSAWVRA